MYSVTILERCIFAMGSLITKSSIMESYCVYGGSPINLLSRGVMLDYDHYMIDE